MVSLDVLRPLTKCWSKTLELRLLPASVIRLIAERAVEQTGRGHRDRFAVKEGDWHYVVTMKSVGRLVISPP